MMKDHTNNRTSQDFFKSLTPIYAEDKRAWEEILTDYTSNDSPDSLHMPTFWNAAASYDITPLAVAAFNGFSFRDRNSWRAKYTGLEHSRRTMALCSDWDIDYKSIHANFKKNPNTDRKQTVEKFKSNGFEFAMDTCIPLSYFAPESVGELNRSLEEEYKKNSPKYWEKKNTDRPLISDEHWHFLYCSGTLKPQTPNRDRPRQIAFFYGLMENVTLLKTVIVPYQFDLQVFCATNVCGKQGWAWFNTFEIETKESCKAWGEFRGRNPLLHEMLCKSTRPRICITNHDRLNHFKDESYYTHIEKVAELGVFQLDWIKLKEHWDTLYKAE